MQNPNIFWGNVIIASKQAYCHTRVVHVGFGLCQNYFFYMPIFRIPIYFCYICFEFFTIIPDGISFCLEVFEEMLSKHKTNIVSCLFILTSRIAKANYQFHLLLLYSICKEFLCVVLQAVKLPQKK